MKIVRLEENVEGRFDFCKAHVELSGIEPFKPTLIKVVLTPSTCYPTARPPWAQIDVHVCSINTLPGTVLHLLGIRGCGYGSDHLGEKISIEQGCF